jgi:dsRNA-specific ribonuclease
LECGINKAKQIINSTLIHTFLKNRDKIADDYKTKLQELVYKTHKVFPVYTSEKSNNVFTAKLLVNGKVFAIGKDKKIKAAEQKAAKAYYLELNNQKI